MAKQKTLKSLKTVQAVIKALGGAEAIAKWTGMGITAPGRWMEWGWIPPAWFDVFEAELRRRGYEVDRSVFAFNGIPHVKGRRPPQHNGEARVVA